MSVFRSGEFFLGVANHDDDILEATPKKLPPLVRTTQFWCGTTGFGMDPPRMVWSSERQVFSCQDLNPEECLPCRPKTKETRPSKQLPWSFLKKNPVEVLSVDEGRGSERTEVLSWVASCPKSTRPKCVVFCGPSNWMCATSHLMWRRRRRKAMEKLECSSAEWHSEGHQLGGAPEQERLAEVFHPKD